MLGVLNDKALGGIDNPRLLKLKEKCLDGRFRKISANCITNSDNKLFYITSYDYSKYFDGTDFVDLKDVKKETLWRLDQTDTLTLLDGENKTVLKWDDENDYLKESNDTDNCKMYNPVKKKMVDGFKPCKENTIWKV